MNEALKRLYACIRVNRYTCREATLRVTLSDNQQLTVEFTSDELTKIACYGADLNSVNPEFGRWQTMVNVYRSIPVDVFIELWSSTDELSQFTWTIRQ